MPARKIRETRVAQRVGAQIDAAARHQPVRFLGPGALYPLRQAAHHPAVDEREQPILFQEGEKGSRRKQLLFFFTDADQYLLEWSLAADGRQRGMIAWA